MVLADGSRPMSRIVSCLSKKNISTTVLNDPDKALDECRKAPPQLVVVGSMPPTVTGVRFLTELLRVSWETATILIADEEEETIHNQTEGLGILGAIKTVDDIEGLEKLLDKFLEITSAAKVN